MAFFRISIILSVHIVILSIQNLPFGSCLGAIWQLKGTLGDHESSRKDMLGFFLVASFFIVFGLFWNPVVRAC